MNYENRTYDGSGNNLEHPEWGRAGQPLLRLVPSAYEGGRDKPSGSHRPNPRAISIAVCTETDPPVPNKAGLSDFMWAWGQFLDHELDLTPEAEGEENAFPIEVPEGDTEFEGFDEIGFQRSAPVPSSGGSALEPREQPNALSAFIDGVNVYGTDETRAKALRTGVDGKLKTSERGNLLPNNSAGLPNAMPTGLPAERFFLAGDVRSNEHAVLASMHTLFMREHNRVADVIKQRMPQITEDNDLYHHARRYVAAEMQVITYQEFLPKLLGANAIPEYDGYDSSVNPGISNIFSTACYRLGHSMLPTQIQLASGEAIDFAELFFRSDKVREDGIDTYLGGLYRTVMREIDVQATDAVRNLLFRNVSPGEVRDLTALNIQRGRDHGLPGYNDCRRALGLPPRRSFNEVSSSADTVARLSSIYAHVDDIDPWLGGLAEDPVDNACVGELIGAVLVDQFQRVRDGDRFWYANDHFFIENPELRELVEQTTLGGIIRNNTGLTNVPNDVFIATPLV